MLEIFLIGIGIVVVLLMIPYLMWRVLLGGNLRSALTNFFNTLHGKDLRVDPEAEILPSERQPISNVIQQQAEQYKQQQSLSTQQAQQAPIPQASIPATTSQPKPNYAPPYTTKPDTIGVRHQPPAVNKQQSAIDVSAQPFVEDHTPTVDDPVIDDKYIDPSTPSADTLDAHIGESDSSRFGVRSAEHSPGRRLRDKRYRRNSS